MCGIVGAVAQRDVSDILLEGLRRLEYRGYDSAGLAVVDEKKQVTRLRCLGKVSVLAQAAAEKTLTGKTGIAHTRWATHGEPSENNAHPHVSENIFVVHNGIIENHDALRALLQRRGYRFTSQTDTEVIAHLTHWEQKQLGGRLCDVVQRVTSQLRGTYALVIMDCCDPSHLLATRSGSPLVIGYGVGENFIASDQQALLPVTCRFVFPDEDDIADVSQHGVTFYNRDGKEVNHCITTVNNHYDASDKGHYRHYMQKEIFEQPIALKNTLTGRIRQGEVDFSELGSQATELFSRVEQIQIVACGTSYHAALVARYWFEALVSLPCHVDIASEFRYRKSAVSRNSLFITLSQSGETADTLAALRLSKKLCYLGSLTICNVAESSLVRESDLALMTRAGAEIGVASTKAFTTQLAVLLMLVAGFCHLKENRATEQMIVRALQALPDRIEQMLLQCHVIERLAEEFSHKQHALFLGRGDQYPIAMEGALKLKEISYIHGEAYAAGELKHGPLALVDDGMPVIVVAPNNELLGKLKSNIEEVRARNGLLYVFADRDAGFTDGGNMKIIPLPHVEACVAPLFYTVPLQLLAYYVALIKGTDVDQPRNLAKSVTVE